MLNFSIYFLFVILGIISIGILVTRFCKGKTLFKNFRNLFVIRHFLYVVLYSLTLAPLKIYGLLYTFDLIGESYKDSIFQTSIYINISIGIIMFFVRCSETKFYKMVIIYCCRKRNSDGTIEPKRTFIDIPLTSIISKNMNLEFMCCILYGLCDIFEKPEKIGKTLSEDITINTILFEKSSNLLNFNKNQKNNLAEKSLLTNQLRKYFIF